MRRRGCGDRRTFVGECLTLAGLGLAVLSASLPWAPAQDAAASGLPGAFYVSPHHAAVTGFALRLGVARVGWLIVLAAAIAALGTLLPASGRGSALMRQAQSFAGFVVIGIALLHAGVYAGVFTAVLCGFALVGGAVARYGSRR